jgi:hypothetical protein
VFSFSAQIPTSICSAVAHQFSKKITLVCR